MRLSVRDIVLFRSATPAIGWIDPTACGFAAYRNDYGVTWYWSGTRAISMMPTASTLSPWRGTFAQNFTDGTPMVEVLMENVSDPTLQGVTASIRYVDNIAGSNANNGLTTGTAWKTVPFAITTVNADGSNSCFDIRVTSSTFYGANSAGWDAGNQSIGTTGTPKWIKITNTAPNAWWLPGMRNAYAAATFAWVDKTNGVFACSTGSISAAAKNSNLVCDLSVLDSDGAPTFSAPLLGPYADETAILAAFGAASNGPMFFYQSSTTTWYVRVASNTAPNPGVNFAYCEFNIGNTFQIAETSPGVLGSRLQVRGFRAIHNCGAASSSILFYAQPLVQVASGVTPAWDTYASFVDCEVYGSSGNAFGFRDILRGVRVRCKAKYCQNDTVNDHSIYIPGNNTSPLQGTLLHSWNENCVGRQMGPNSNIWRTQPTASTSNNGPTAHDGCHMTVVGGEYTETYGAQCAITLGAQCLMIGVTLRNPTNTTTGTGTTSSRSNLWADGKLSTTPGNGSKIWSVFGRYTVDSLGVNYYANDIAGIVVCKTLTPGKATQRASTTCTIVDQNGVSI